MCDGAIAIGRRLLRVKEILPRGEFGKSIDSEFDWGERTAQNYMRLTDAFGENAQRLADLPLRSLYALATQPAATRERVLDLVDKGERPAEQDHHLHHPSCREERRRAAADQREKARTAKMTDEEREHEDRSRQSLKKLKANLAAKKEQERAVWEKEQRQRKLHA